MTKTPWNVYPRPQMKRQRWLSLNGQWQLEGHPVTVPFPPQSMLSGYGQPVAEQLTYETCFTIPEDWAGSRILLHFSAVDQIAEVWLNGKPVGRHEGGYLPFHFDITKYLQAGENKLTLCATDTLDHTYPYGKQTKKPGGMWYTPVSGIWQSVWLEPVPVDYLHGLRLDCDQKGVTLTLEGWNGGFDAQVEGKHYHFEGNSGRIEPEDPQLWSPEQPHLYSLQITAGEDQIESYFALRSIAIGEVQGVQRVLLNGQPIFLHGVLDQGYFPDGIFLPEDPEEFDRDVLRMKELGLNLLRKHIKIEPEQFYYACDRLGMLV
ncbi:MAG: glycoside hydrolase family 2, partial [Oscillospiraceae bacterium]|nr:glycoside hydrolase family 2 [Oscillospiraceae bacterium]